MPACCVYVSAMADFETGRISFVHRYFTDHSSISCYSILTQPSFSRSGPGLCCVPRSGDPPAAVSSVGRPLLPHAHHTGTGNSGEGTQLCNIL